MKTGSAAGCTLMLTALAVFATPAGRAQPALAFSPDTLVSGVRLGNVGSESIRLDSLRVDACERPPPGPCGYGYSASLQSGSIFIHRYILPIVDDTVPLFTGQTEIVLAPGDSATLSMGPIDPCPVCAVPTTLWEHVIALEIWAGADAVPIMIPYAFDIPVGVEREPGGQHISLSVSGHNPFRESTELLLMLVASTRVDISIHDSLGRRVRVLHSGAISDGTHRLAVDADGMSPGLFFVRAVALGGPGAAVATVPLVLVR